jgi:5,5'-dehydrodivanillate O-demethylase
MLSKEENQLLMQVGPGTPMGNLMRRYWQPVAAVEELNEKPTKQIRLMGENLVIYKDKSGTYGVLDLHCPHRRADMSYGMVEDCGLRCNYHGWKFDDKGDCIDQPFEKIAHPDANFKDKVKIKSYRIEAKAGLLWVYMGPDPVPCLWDWDAYHFTGYKQITFSNIACNWLQCAENDIDPVHFEWLHTNWSEDISGRRDPDGSPIPTHLQIGFDEFEWGIFYRRILEGDSEWVAGRVALWPNCLMPGGAHFEWRVPVDDFNTLSVSWTLDVLPGEEPFEQEKIPYWWSPITDEATGRWINSNTVNQDIIAWVGQGVQSDRENEHLGESDRGVIMMRQRFLKDIKVVEDGGDPKGILRDQSRNHALSLRPAGHDFSYPAVEPSFAPGRDAKLVRSQAEARQQQLLAAIAGNGAGERRRRGTAAFLFFGQPDWIADEYERIYDERLAKLPAEKRASVPRLPAAAD